MNLKSDTSANVLSGAITVFYWNSVDFNSIKDEVTSIEKYSLSENIRQKEEDKDKIPTERMELRRVKITS